MFFLHVSIARHQFFLRGFPGMVSQCPIQNMDPIAFADGSRRSARLSEEKG